MPNPTEKAKQMVDRMFGDRSCPQSETRGNLRDIIEHCDVLIDRLEDEFDDEFDDEDDEFDPFQE